MQVIQYKFKCDARHTPIFKEVITEAFIKPFNKKYMPKFRKKPVVIEAMQFTGNNTTEIMLFVGKRLEASTPPRHMEFDREISNDSYTIVIPTPEGDMTAIKMDWIIKGIKGEFYPCKPDIFEKTYEPVD